MSGYDGHDAPAHDGHDATSNDGLLGIETPSPSSLPAASAAGCRKELFSRQRGANGEERRRPNAGIPVTCEVATCHES